MEHAFDKIKIQNDSSRISCGFYFIFINGLIIIVVGGPTRLRIRLIRQNRRHLEDLVDPTLTKGYILLCFTSREKPPLGLVRDLDFSFLSVIV